MNIVSLFWFAIFLNVALAIGQGPRDMDVMRITIVAMAIIGICWYHWQNLIPKKIFAVCEITLWSFMMIYAIMHKMTLWIGFGACLAAFIGIIFLATYLEMKKNKKESASVGNS